MNQNHHLTEDLFRSLGARLKQFIQSRVSDSAAADDILQDVFVKIHSRVDTLRDETRLEGWVYQITRNAITDYYRTRRPAERSSAAIEPYEMPPEESAVEKLSPGIREMIDSLPSHYREALLLTEYQGLSQKELADRLGISISGAKSRVQRARAMLRDLLMECCHFEFDRYGTVIDYRPIACCCCSRTRPAAHT
jgi:RNA polymerase sigma-70 factor (ECF subfamily)